MIKRSSAIEDSQETLEDRISCEEVSNERLSPFLQAASH